MRYTYTGLTGPEIHDLLAPSLTREELAGDPYWGETLCCLVRQARTFDPDLPSHEALYIYETMQAYLYPRED
jgi:hypothetical protein